MTDALSATCPKKRVLRSSPAHRIHSLSPDSRISRLAPRGSACFVSWFALFSKYAKFARTQPTLNIARTYLLLMSLLLCLAVSCDDSGIDSSIITPDKVEEKVYFAGSIPTYIKDALKHYMPYSTSNIAEAKVVVGSSAGFRFPFRRLWGQ